MFMEERQHSRFAPSGANIWINCTGSVQFTQELREQDKIDESPSIYAQAGTDAHALLEEALRAFYNGDINTDNLCDDTRVAYDYITNTFNEANLHVIEQRVSLSDINPELFGTLDFGAYIAKTRTLHIVDYKHGFVEVDPYRNYQLMYYALGLARKFSLTMPGDIEHIELTIIQPRAFEQESIKSYKLTHKELTLFRILLEHKVKSILNGNTYLKSGSHCNYCKAKVHCPRFRADLEESLGVSIDDLETTEATALDESKIITLFKQSAKIEKLLKDCSSYLYFRLVKGEKIEGIKLVKKRVMRKFRSDKEVLEAFSHIDKAKLYSNPKLKSPAQIEKIPGIEKKDVANLLLDQSENHEYTIVTEDNSRDSVDPVGALSELV